MLHTKIVSFALFVCCMNNVFSASEQFLKHEQLKEDFKLSTFMSLPPDPQYDVLEFLKLNEKKFQNRVSKYNIQRVQEFLVSEFFYNHAKKYDKKLKEKQGKTDFSIQQEQSQLSTIRDYQGCNGSFFTLIDWAAWFDNSDYTLFLIGLGVDINITNPLYHACYSQHYNAAITLIQAGAYCDNLGTPLHFIARDWHKKTSACYLAKILIQKGYDVNQLDEICNKAPLHYAVDLANLPLIQLLLEHGARVDIHDKDGETALDCADYSHEDDYTEDADCIIDILQQAEIKNIECTEDFNSHCSIS